jgi:hypothetical protein
VNCGWDAGEGMKKARKADAEEEEHRRVQKN